MPPRICPVRGIRTKKNPPLVKEAGFMPNPKKNYFFLAFLVAFAFFFAAIGVVSLASRPFPYVNYTSLPCVNNLF